MRSLTQSAISNLKSSISNASCLALLVVCFSPAYAAEPTLARLAFWVPPDRIAEFETAYEQKVVPILQKRGLVPSSRKGRATPDSVFSRLFSFKTPSDAVTARTGLSSDPAWIKAKQDLGTTFGTSRGKVGGNGRGR